MAQRQRLYTKELAQGVLNLITTNLADTLSLKVASVGDISMLPAPEELDTWIPAVLIKAGKIPINLISMPGGFEVTYPYTIYYVTWYNAGEVAEEKKIDETQQIVELLIDNYKLNDIALTNGKIGTMEVKEVDFDSEEERVLRAMELEVSLAKIYIEILTTTSR